MQPLDESELWRSKNPRWGTVRTVTISGDYALVLDDLNSDYREVDEAIFRRDGDGWRQIHSQDDTAFPQIGDHDPYRGQWGPGGLTYGGTADELYGYAWGRQRPGHVVHIHFNGETTEVRANEDGWWLFVGPTTIERSEVPVWMASQ